MKIFFAMIAVFVSSTNHQRQRFTFGWLKPTCTNVLHIQHSRQISLKIVCVSHRINIHTRKFELWAIQTCISPPKNITCCFSCPVTSDGHTMTSFCFPSAPTTFASLFTGNSPSKQFVLSLAISEKSTCRQFSSCTVDKRGSC